MTDQEVIRIGTEFRRLVRSESFDKAVETLRNHYASEILRTRTDEAYAREELYRRAVVLDDLIGTINEFIFKAEQDAQRSAANEDEIINIEFDFE